MTKKKPVITAKKKQKVAIFDIDGTIFRSSLLSELTEALIQEGIFSKKVRDEYIEEYSRWLDREGDYYDYMWAIVGVFEKEIKGVKNEVFLKIVKKVVDFHQNRVYRYTRDLLKKLKKQNYYLIAISHSPKDAVREFAKRVGFDKMYGRQMEVDDKGRITGKILFENTIMDKAKMLSVAVETHDLTLKDSIGVGDTSSDIPFLKMVDHPICFNPNSQLYKFAKKNKWEIVVERKDVIYHL